MASRRLTCSLAVKRGSFLGEKVGTIGNAVFTHPAVANVVATSFHQLLRFPYIASYLPRFLFPFSPFIPSFFLSSSALRKTRLSPPGSNKAGTLHLLV